MKVQNQRQLNYSIKCQISPQNLICPVCLKIPSPQDEIVECFTCAHVFCKIDYSKIIHKNCCPICKTLPWTIKRNINPIFQNAIKNIQYHCIICKKQQQYNYKEIEQHLKIDHNKLLKQPKQLWNYYFEINKNFLYLQKIQNIYLNLLQAQNITMAKIYKQRDQIAIDLQQNLIIFNNKIYNLLRQKSKNIQKNKIYYIWEIIVDKVTYMYSSTVQSLLQKAYQKFIEVPYKSQLLLIIGDNQYRMCFKQMLQMNVKTGWKRKISRKQFQFT